MAKHVMYPYRRVHYSSKSSQCDKWKDYVGVMCDTCYRGMRLRASMTLNIRHITDPEVLGITKNSLDAFEHEMDCPIAVEPTIKFTCPNCGAINKTSTILGPNITPILSILNQKGFITVGSDEGHRVNQDTHAMPYVKFKHPGLRKVVESVPLTSPWHLDDSANNEFIIRCDNLSIPIKERMAALRKWAEDLPTIPKDTLVFDKMLITPESVQDAKRQYSTKVAASLLASNINKNFDADMLFLFEPRKTSGAIVVDVPPEVADVTDQYTSQSEIKHIYDDEDKIAAGKAHKAAIKEKKRTSSNKRYSKKSYKKKTTSGNNKPGNENATVFKDTGRVVKYKRP